MLHTTFALAKKAGACTSEYEKMAKALGGVDKYGADTPIGLDKVVEVCGLENAIWALQCTNEDSENVLIEFACRCAEHVLHFYEEKYPDDKRPRQAIEAGRVCLTDKTPAARAAAGAAWKAADAAARAAAWVAEAAGAAWAARAAAGEATWPVGAAWEAAAREAAWAAGATWAAGAAWKAADAAARAAAGEAAGAAEATGAAEAAWDAVGEAEWSWQNEQFLELLKEN